MHHAPEERRRQGRSGAGRQGGRQRGAQQVLVELAEQLPVRLACTYVSSFKMKTLSGILEQALNRGVFQKPKRVQSRCAQCKCVASAAEPVATDGL